MSCRDIRESRPWTSTHMKIAHADAKHLINLNAHLHSSRMLVIETTPKLEEQRRSHKLRRSNTKCACPRADELRNMLAFKPQENSETGTPGRSLTFLSQLLDCTSERPLWTHYASKTDFWNSNKRCGEALRPRG